MIKRYRFAPLNSAYTRMKSQYFLLSIPSLISTVVLVVVGGTLSEAFASIGTVFAIGGNIIIKISTWLAALSHYVLFGIIYQIGRLKPMNNNESLIEYLELDTEYAALIDPGIDPHSVRTRNDQIPLEQLESEISSLHQQYMDLLTAQQITRETQTLLDELNIKATSLGHSAEDLNAKLKLQDILLVELAANSLQPFTIAVRIFLVSLVGAAALAFFSGKKAVATHVLAFGVGAASLGVCCEVAGSRSR